MKYNKTNLLNKDFLEKEIQSNLDFILQNINWSKPQIKIHINNPSRLKDYPRMFFILFSLSRLYKLKEKNNLSINNLPEKNIFLKLFLDIYELAKAEENLENLRYVQLYSMRILKNLNEKIDQVIEDFKLRNFASIFKYPICTGLFISVFNEIPELKEKFTYSQTIYNQCLQTFDYILFSEIKYNYEIFKFSEISNHANHIPKYILNKMIEYTNEKIVEYISQKNSFSSGIAKLMEDLSRREDFTNLEKCFFILQKRNIKNYTNFINTGLLSLENVYSEQEDNLYICLDTSGHLIQCFVNLYEKI